MAETTNKSLTLKDLPEYIDQRSEELITKSVFAPMSTTLFKVQSANPGLMRCRQILYHLSHQGSQGSP